MPIWTAYIDGSHQYHSKTSGWSFIVQNDLGFKDKFFGEIVPPWLYEFEQYAFAKLIEYCVKHNIAEINVKTDYFQLLKDCANIENAVDFCQKYLPTSLLGHVKANLAHIPRSQNKEADRLSRRYLIDAFLQEKKEFEKELANNRVNGNYKHPHINFIHSNKLLYCSKSSTKNTERKVMYAVKSESLIIEIIAQEENIHKLNVMTFKNKIYTYLETFIIKGNYRDALLEKLQEYKSYKNILLSLSKDKHSFFEQITGFTINEQSEEFNQRFYSILDELDCLFVYERSLTGPAIRVKNKVKNKIKLLSMDEKKTIYLSMAGQSKKALSVLIGWRITEFKKSHKRVPTEIERIELINEVRMSLLA